MKTVIIGDIHGCCKKEKNEEMTRILCFGDSNTYGYDACSMFGERLPESQRWPDILGKLSGWEVINEGMNGRMIPREPWIAERFDRLLEKSGPADLIVIMLGTNDLLNSYCPDIKVIGNRMELFVRHVQKHPMVNGKGERILLMAPPHTDVGRFREADTCYDREAEKFGVCYREIAERYALRYADAAEWELPLAYDGVHISPKGHEMLAQNLWLLMKEFF